MTAPSNAHFKSQYDRHLKHLQLKGLRPKTIDAYARAVRRVCRLVCHVNDNAARQPLCTSL